MMMLVIAECSSYQKEVHNMNVVDFLHKCRGTICYLCGRKGVDGCAGVADFPSWEWEGLMVMVDVVSQSRLRAKMLITHQWASLPFSHLLDGWNLWISD
jgi:hypothetical protein